uniref:RING-type E3 ubiquitin transferase n=1 Tax=Chelydra serpentina TaxID=8475 RepID=A0A8C3SL94_CHESE
IISQLPYGKALYTYEGKEPGDLKFTKGDIIILRRKVDENWYHGELNGNHGFFPASYIQCIKPLPQAPPQGKALYDFEIKDKDQDKDCLTFTKNDELELRKGEMYRVIEKCQDGWFKGTSLRTGMSGVFPGNYVTPQKHFWLPPTTALGSPPPPASPDTPALGSHSPTSALPHLHPLPPQRWVLWAEPGGEEPGQGSPRGSGAPESGTQALHGSAPGTGHLYGPATAAASGHPAAAPGWLGPYRVVVPYPPQSEAEIELKEGDIVFVHKKREDGWYKGTLQRNGRTGLFPGSFVESF